MTDNRKKFLFDLHDFEKEAEEEREKRKNKTPPAPTFSLEDMEEARKDAFEKGKEHGLQMAKDSIEQKTELLIQSFAENIKQLEAAEGKRAIDYHNNAVAMTFKALHKILTPLLDANKEELIKSALDEFFQDTPLKSDMTLSVHPSMKEAVSRHIQTISPFIKIKDDDSMPTEQAHVEWETGAFEFKPDVLLERILQILEARVVQTEQTSVDDLVKNTHTEDETPTAEQDS